MPRKLAVCVVMLCGGALAIQLVLVGQQLPQAPHSINFGRPMAPTSDMYYVEEPKETWIPDEFISNPDSTIDPTKLLGYHYPPILHKVNILNPVVRAGETVRFEAMVEDPTEINPWSITFEGPKGRRTSLTARFTPKRGNPFLFDGTLQVHQWAEPGLYIPYVSIIPNELGHSKAYFQEYHPGMKDLTFTVLPHENVDTTPPVLKDFRIGETATAGAQVGTYDITQAIPIYSQITDDRSGVKEIKIRFTNPEGKYTQTELSPLMGQKDWFVGYINIPEWYVGGEYKPVSMWFEDNAGQQSFLFGTTNPLLKAPTGRFNIRQDPSKVDKNPPKLVTLNLDKTTAALGSEIRVTAVVVDDKSGVGTVVVDFASVPSYADHKRTHLKAVPQPAIVQKSGFNVNTNTYTGTFRTHVMDEPGEWHVTRVMARDNADNQLDLRETEHTVLGSVKVNMTGGVRRTGIGGGGAGPAAASATAAAGSATGQGAAAAPKIRRVDMIAPHPPRGACLNCHEP